NDAYNGVEKLASANQLDRIGHDLAAHERRAHAFGAHGLAVADRDGVELHRRAACGAYAFLHLGGQAAQMKVAGHGFDPRVRDPDQRLLQVFAGKSDRFEHGTGASAIPAVRNIAATMFSIHKSKSLRQSSRKRKLGCDVRRNISSAVSSKPN